MTPKTTDPSTKNTKNKAENPTTAAAAAEEQQQQQQHRSHVKIVHNGRIAKGKYAHTHLTHTHRLALSHIHSIYFTATIKYNKFYFHNWCRHKQPDHVFGHLPYSAEELSTTSPTTRLPSTLSRPVLAWPGKQANYLKYFPALHYFCSPTSFGLPRFPL